MMSTEDLDHLRHLTDHLQSGPSGFFDESGPPTSILLATSNHAEAEHFSNLVTKQLGVNVFVGLTANHALQILEAHRDQVAVMVSDSRLTGAHNGPWLLQQAHQRWPKMMRILLNQVGDATDPSSADAVIPKPWDRKQLMDALNLYILKVA